MISTIITALGMLVLLVVVGAGWVATLLGLPGNWVILVACALYAWLNPAERFAGIGWSWIVALAILAVIGEVLEFAAGALGTASAGGSARAAVYALVGSMIGGVAGALVGLPIPVVGSLVAVMVFGGVGAALGATAGEWSGGADIGGSARVGWSAFWGRLLGTGAKTLVGSVMVACVVAALVL